jgi:hypothetical protein
MEAKQTLVFEENGVHKNWRRYEQQNDHKNYDE